MQQVLREESSHKSQEAMIGDRNVTSEPTKKLSKRGHIESEDEGNNFMLSRNNDDTFMEDMYKEL